MKQPLKTDFKLKFLVINFFKHITNSNNTELLIILMATIKHFYLIILYWGKPPAHLECQPLPNSACGLILLPPATTTITLATPKTLHCKGAPVAVENR